MKPMNGIDPALADRFWEKWHFVTTRYRRDKNETRIIYANDLAWEAMVERKPTYPDGAVFVKASFVTAPDPNFTASLVPRDATELQIMKKDVKSYPETEGWGYGIWLYSNLESGNSGETLSCYSCHKIVKDRDFIFAMPAFLSWYVNDPSVEEPRFRASFTERKISDLPELGQKVVHYYGDASITKVKFLSLPGFDSGQLMSLASVGQFAEKDGMPYLMIGLNHPTFLFLVPGQPCSHFFMTEYREPKHVNQGTICGSDVTYGAQLTAFSGH